MSIENKSNYTQTNKFIRDLVHGYIHITEFEREIIDTVEFQRLKDIRQLTCQQVYPSARHTRFEHSLGVLELTRQALIHLNRNGFIQGYDTDTHDSDETMLVFDNNMIFNGTLAALLHDVGHCPFSHLGETIFDEDEVNERLFEIVTGTYSEQYKEEYKKKYNEELPAENIDNKYIKFSQLFGTDKDVNAKHGYLAEKFKKSYDNAIKKIPGATHEKLSCIVIMEKFYDKLSRNLEYLKVDFELLFRCILGIEYDVTSDLLCTYPDTYNENQKKNVIVNLINSKIFDMDKLDYIMRDSYMTGIGTPAIDTKRLFKNMHLSENYTLVFTNRAVPALQNMIEARDGLYMYVYNHHAAVYSDFMNFYIFRRMEHLVGNYDILLQELVSANQKGNAIDVSRLKSCYIENLCFIPKNTIFSVGAVLDENRSDSDIVSLLNMQYQSVKQKLSAGNLEEVKNYIKGMLEEDLQFFGIKTEPIYEELEDDPRLNNIADGIKHTFELLEKYLNRNFLKPWWKTNFEFNNFINKNFSDDTIRKTLCQWICNKGDAIPEGAEFRSQLAKHMRYITEREYEDEEEKILQDGDFFVIERPTSFFAPDTIKKLDIALKKSEILGSPNESKYQTDDYYIKELTNIIPQRDYDSLYSKNSFYIFSKKLNNDDRDYYQTLEKIFTFVATELVKHGEARFQVNFVVADKAVVKDNEKKSQEEIYQKYQRLFCN